MFSETYWSYIISKISSSPYRIENPQGWRPTSIALLTADQAYFLYILTLKNILPIAVALILKNKS